MPQKQIVPCKSFVKNLIKAYFSTNEIIKAFCISILLSNFIYIDILDNIFLNFISPFLAIFGFFLLLRASKICYFWSGFFIGILWFYWISFSLIYYEMAFLIPIEILFIALAYGVIFRILGAFASPIIRAILLCLVSFVHPFGFDWLNMELTLIHGIFEPNLRGLGFVFVAILAYFYLPKFKNFAWVILLGALQFSQTPTQMPNFGINLANTKVPQSIKWSKENLNNITMQNFALIDQAIQNGDKMVVLPETAFPLILNESQILGEKLIEKSYEIAIFTGGFWREKADLYNSAYLIQNGEISHFNKVFLVPFGEEIPLPKFLKKLINNIFFDGAEDFKKAENFSEFNVNSATFESTICYEITRKEAYQTKAPYIVAITNNAWFVPSSEPNLQRIIIKYYATKYAKIVFHSVNGSPSEIIKPKNLWINEVRNFIK